MIARNYRRYPEAMLYQFELALDSAVATIQAIRTKGGAAWRNLVHRYYAAHADIRGVTPVPKWVRDMKARATELMKELQRSQQALGDA
ncbi:MAG: hypothetical protein Q8O29_08575 [Polaromonas sp.]|uniref:hypothetical protein n=1 Tax=Polaromonas sp. TaxID=1869339 RepID=UPI0027364AE2|nr:hypothetical protein [Polaromonas sp.]MDP2818320.1 hypothetical protein [Polaromonas sp.]